MAENPETRGLLTDMEDMQQGSHVRDAIERCSWVVLAALLFVMDGGLSEVEMPAQQWAVLKPGTLVPFRKPGRKVCPLLPKTQVPIRNARVPPRMVPSEQLNSSCIAC